MRQSVFGGAVLAVLLSGALVAAAAVEPFVPARYLNGPLPQIPIQAVSAGEVFLELTVSDGGSVSRTKILRTTPPYTDVMTAAVQQWFFRPAEEEIKPSAGEPAEPKRWKRVESKVLVAGIFRPPTVDTPTLGELPKDVVSASNESPSPVVTGTPAYPALALFDGIVLVESRIGPDGSVTDATVIHSAPPFDQPALDAARHWTFRPARVNGVAVSKLAYIMFAFRQPLTASKK